MKSSDIRTVILLLAAVIPMAEGCLKQQVWQSGPQTVDRGSSLKLNCSFSLSLQLQKPSLTWIKIDENERETRIYPSDRSSDSARFLVNSEGFRISRDAGILLSDLRGRDSGLYVCSVTVHQTGQECRAGGTHLTVRVTLFDTLIACCPLGVLIAALLVLHCMVYKQWMEYKKDHNRIGNAFNWRMCSIHIPRVSFDFIEFFSML
ncbi:uncharacterized protein LOC121008387 [Bufo bufo]|uniref:uncharacterized protein LOC121008387 n=1 Tax=Bufo bufo TaxID=8384 RepID=UPI001ABEDA99|nr:uncharacterized protein LOC121008387 [Bufo bufo]